MMIPRRNLKLTFLLMGLLLSGCAANNMSLTRSASDGSGNARLFHLRQFPMGLSAKDAITVIVDTLEGNYSHKLENEVSKCVRVSFNKPGFPIVRLISADEFRSVALPDLTPEQALSSRWDQLMGDPVFRERTESLNLRYLIAVTVSTGRTLAEFKGHPVIDLFHLRDSQRWEWERFAVIKGTVVDLRNTRTAGVVSAAVRKASTAGFIPIPAPPLITYLTRNVVFVPSPIPFVNPSFVEGPACREFGAALAKFLASEESTPPLIMSSLGLGSLFPQRHRSTQHDYLTESGNRVSNLNTGTMDMRASGVLPGFNLPPNELAQFVGQSKTTPGTAGRVAAEDISGTNRWEEIRPLIKARKNLAVHEDGGNRGSIRGAGFEGELCHELKLSLNTLTLNTQALPPLPTPWHLIPAWVSKAASLPVVLSIPVVPILVAPLNPLGAARGLETLYGCLPELRDRTKTEPSKTVGIRNDARSESMTSMASISSQSAPSTFTTDRRGSLNVHRAAETGDVETVRLLIAAEKHLVNAKNQAAQTPLHIAASSGYTAVAELLLASGADPNSQDWQGATPLQLASRGGNYGVIALLTKNNSATDQMTADKQPPF